MAVVMMDDYSAMVMGCLDIHISAALTACSSAKVIGVFGILPLISSSFSLIKQAQVVVLLSWELASV